MSERKDASSLTSSDSNPHLPPSVYQPNPFPINPSEGNPWAPSQNYQRPPQGNGSDNTYTSSAYSYGHGNNASSDSESQSSYPAYMPMPAPNNSSYDYSSNTYNTSAYNNKSNAYDTSINFNAYEHSQPEHDDVKHEQDNNTAELDESASAANPGIETHDPDKLKISSQMVENTSNGAPNKWRLLSRFIQFLTSVGAFALIVSAQVNPATKNHGELPDAVQKSIIFTYIVSAVSFIYSFGHLIFYCLRSCAHKNKAPRWSLMFIDAVLGASFGTLMVFLIKDFKCKPGDLNGWCDFYNSTIFFVVLAFLTYVVSFIWDIVGGFRKRS